MTWRFRSRPSPPASPGKPSFNDIVLPNLDAAYNLARWLMRDPQQAEDVVQDSVVRALNYFETFRGGDGRAWLMKIVRNTAYTALAARQQSRKQIDERPIDSGPNLDMPDPGESPEAAVGRLEETAWLERTLADLPDELREVIVLKEFEDLSYKEIAHVIGVPIGTVMSRLWRARQALLDANPQGGEDDR